MCISFPVAISYRYNIAKSDDMSCIEKRMAVSKEFEVHDCGE